MGRAAGSWCLAQKLPFADDCLRAMTLMQKLEATPMDNELDSAWEQALADLNTTSGWDYTLSRFDGWRLQISCGTSEDRQRPIAFLRGVSYLSCPLVFSHPKFRLADGEERAAVQPFAAADGFAARCSANVRPT